MRLAALVLAKRTRHLRGSTLRGKIVSAAAGATQAPRAAADSRRRRGAPNNISAELTPTYSFCIFCKKWQNNFSKFYLPKI